MKTRQAIAMTQLRLLKQLPVVHAIGALVRTVYLEKEQAERAKLAQEVTLMTQPNQIQAELERQQLIKQCHCLIAAIANRPGAIKLLRGILPMLEMYASYKPGRSHCERG